MQIAAIGGICWASTYVKKSRIITMIVVILFALVGVILMNALPDSNRWGRWVGIFLLGPFATSIPISLSLITSNVGGFTKKATVSAMLFLAYCTGNIIGPQLFLDSEAPKYTVSITAYLFTYTVTDYCRPDLKESLLDSLLRYSSWCCCISTTRSRTDGETGNTVQVVLTIQRN